MPLITFGSMNFCNVSIKVLSPVCDVDTIRDEMAHVCKIAVQHALCTCLEPGHKLMHPCMPFVTEGLAFHFIKVEKELDAVLEGVKIICFIAQKETASIQIDNVSLLHFFESEKSTMVALSKGVSELLILDASTDAPANHESGPADEKAAFLFKNV
ncbi:hypothetical protein G6F66_003636 [Rhizopus arrhizus]|nr:hypothetical protein G6F66_003636 [Rhizopus arrhizus]